MSVPNSPALEAEKIREEVLAVLKSGKGFYYHVIWSRVLGIHFRNSPENDHRLRQTLDSLVQGGQVIRSNGWYALKETEPAR